METWKSVVTVPILLPETLHLWHLQLDATNFIKPARTQFSQTRIWLRQIMGGYLGNIAPEQLQFGYSHYGKPFIKWPQPAPHFNLSHSNSLCVLAVYWNAPIGIDIELIQERTGIEKIAQRCFNDDIVAELNELSEDTRLHRFYYYWTLFEAQLKAQGGSIFNAKSNNTCQIETANFIPAPGFQGCIATLGKLPHKNTWQMLKFVI